MKLVSFGGDRVGLIDNDRKDVVDITPLLGEAPHFPPMNMVRAIANFPEVIEGLQRSRGSLNVHALDAVELEAPISWPNKFVAFPANYQDHIEEMSSRNRSTVNGFFLKANSSIIGPQSQITLPMLPGYEVHHECELAVIIGQGGRHISPESALDHVFGYTCLVDVTVRGSQERVMRKSYDTFAPLGPWITTKDEVPDADALDLQLSVNGEVRQRANTRDLLLNVPSMISLVSSVSTLYPGDVIATGTPAGVGPLREGDTVSIRIESVGSMSLQVRQGDGGSNLAFERATSVV